MNYLTNRSRAGVLLAVLRMGRPERGLVSLRKSHCALPALDETPVPI